MKWLCIAAFGGNYMVICMAPFLYEAFSEEVDFHSPLSLYLCLCALAESRRACRKLAVSHPSLHLAVERVIRTSPLAAGENSEPSSSFMSLVIRRYRQTPRVLPQDMDIWTALKTGNPERARETILSAVDLSGFAPDGASVLHHL